MFIIMRVLPFLTAAVTLAFSYAKPTIEVVEDVLILTDENFKTAIEVKKQIFLLCFLCDEHASCFYGCELFLSPQLISVLFCVCFALLVHNIPSVTG